MLALAMDIGADDVVMIDDGALLFCSVDMLGTCANECAERNLAVRETRIVYEPNTMLTVTDPEQMKLLDKLLDVLDDNDDVQNVFHNAELPDEDAE
jgi:transcriptional/translational regulatory protein YebC/TACO1